MTRRPLLLVCETAQATMIAAAVRAHPLETGGILVGVYADGWPWVASAIEIASTDRGRRHYRIPVGTTTPVVYDARRSDPRLGYLGDWHSHPDDVGPSTTDLASLILVSARNPRHANPSLVVVRNTADGYVLDARRIVVVAPRVCEPRLAGGLPPPAPPRGTPTVDEPEHPLPSNQIPSPSGARIAGDDYQWLHAWRMCMEMLHEDVAGDVANPVVAIGVEEPGVGNGDDVVLHRLHPPNAYIQVKYAVDHRTAVNLAYLDQQDILRRMVRAHSVLTAGGTPVEMRLVTNRTIDPGDVLLRDRDGRDRRLLPRAAQGSARSERGRARAAWAATASVDEPALMAFLEQFHLDVAYDLDRLRRDVSLLMTANGLRSDPVAVNIGADWVLRQVVAGHRRLSVEDLRSTAAALDLRVGSLWTTISIATIKHDLFADQAAVAIDWVDRIGGDTEWNRIVPEPPATWDDLAADIRTLPHRLDGPKRILVSGHMRQATSFLVGSELRRVMGYEVGIRQGDQLWTNAEHTERYALTVTEIATEAGSGTAIIVNVATDAAADVISWITRTDTAVGRILTVTPERGTGPNSVSTPGDANSLAVAIRDLARRHSRAGHLHLFLIGPLGLAVLLGHHWNRLATTHVYEHVGGTDYVHAFTVHA